MKAAVVGASGYVGGELLRLLLRHPRVESLQAVSARAAGEPVARVHPNLRKSTALAFDPPEALRPSDVLFAAVPHGESAPRMAEWMASARRVIDLGADFRLRAADRYPEYYGFEHPRPELLARAVYGLPELHRAALASAPVVAGPGCMAAASILALAPLARAGVIDPEHVVVDTKTGSSASGAEPGPAGAHAERSGAMRLYSPAGHRHTAEIEQETGCRVAMSCHGVEAVRGVLATCHAYVRAPVTEKELWRIYRAAYADEPFVRLVHEASGVHRVPEPKILSGTNYCDIGFAADPHAGRIVAVAALDNLGKGAAGNAIQCWNAAEGFPETLGLEFPGLHPI